MARSVEDRFRLAASKSISKRVRKAKNKQAVAKEYKRLLRKVK